VPEANRPSRHAHGRSEVLLRPGVVPELAKAKQQLADNTARLRRAVNLSQEHLAERAGLHVKHVQRIERGDANPTLTTLIGVAVALEVSLPELLTSDPLGAPDEFNGDADAIDDTATAPPRSP